MDCQKHLFRLDPDVHYLNCAYMAPMLRAVEAAGEAGIRRRRTPSDITAQDFFTESDLVRAAFARILGADAQRVALMPSASYGIASAARNVHIESGQSILLLEEQFPSNVYSWARLAEERGATLVAVAPPTEGAGRGERWNQALLDAIEPHTAVVSVPHYHWSDGTRFDLVEVGRACRAVGAQLVVDGTQSVGAAPFDLEAIQPAAVVCAGYKTLFGPYGFAVAWMSSDFDGGVPLEENWITRERSDDFARLVDYEESYRPGALRYDMGERSNPVLLPMALAALEQVHAWGTEAIQAYADDLLDETLRELREAGYWIEDRAWRGAHLFGLRPPEGTDIPAMARALADARVMVSLRGSAVRVAPHVYNDASDVAAFRSALLSVMAAT